MHHGVEVKLFDIFIIMLATLGPFKLILPFYSMTYSLKYKDVFKVSIYVTIISSVLMFFTVGYGPFIMNKWGLSIQSISISCGVVLFIQGLAMSMRNPALAEEELIKNHDQCSKLNPLQIAHKLIIPGVITPAGIMLILAARSIHFSDIDLLVEKLIEMISIILAANFITMLIAPFICKVIKPIYFRLLIWVFSIFVLILGVHIILETIRHIKFQI